jgi:hypothetical protein
LKTARNITPSYKTTVSAVSDVYSLEKYQQCGDREEEKENERKRTEVTRGEISF